ncbi:MAG: thiamine phosphate synthase [Rubrobacter sp.]
MKHSLQNARLLLVTDPREDLVERIAAAVKGGVEIVQLRDKHTPAKELLPLAEELREVCEPDGAIFTVNDDVELARISGAHGVHLGQDDGPLAPARKSLGVEVIVGRSVGTVEEARIAAAEGADYLGVGAMYATPTKPDGEVAGLQLVRDVARADLGLPFYAIGGVTLQTAPEIAEAGAWGFAVVRAVLDAEDPEAAARKLRALLP